MKRSLAITAVVLLAVFLLTACNFTSSSSNVAEAESTAKVEEMLQALTDDDADAPFSLLHPDAAGNSENAVDQMRDFLAGRTVAEMKQTSMRANTSSGSSGKTRQEATNFQVILDDGTQIYIAAVYCWNDSGEGFTSFQIVLGIV